jgi:hypothetical protein
MLGRVLPMQANDPSPIQFPVATLCPGSCLQSAQASHSSPPILSLSFFQTFRPFSLTLILTFLTLFGVTTTNHHRHHIFLPQPFRLFSPSPYHSCCVPALGFLLGDLVCTSSLLLNSTTTCPGFRRERRSLLLFPQLRTLPPRLRASPFFFSSLPICRSCL